MQTGKFGVVKFISRGSYSFVYEVVCTQGCDDTKVTITCALMRFYFSAVRCALREHRILVRLARREEQSPFLATLFQSFLIRGAPALVLLKGSGFNLRDPISYVGLLGEKHARFYSCEITNFTGTPFYMAPEVKKGVEITIRADVRSLGILVAYIMYGHATAQDWLHSCRFTTGRLPNVSVPLRKFFNACLTYNHNKRVDIDGVKRLEFFKHVDWEEVEKFDPVSYDPMLLAAVSDRNMPLITKQRGNIRDKHGVFRVMLLSPECKEPVRVGLTAKRIDELFADFDFINPRLLQSSHGFNEKQAVGVDELASLNLKQCEVEDVALTMGHSE
ncbi:unnamed protein product [Taenia asiatica]|uniref:Protein kinase domain-containing protein n=1 Tax=Taenia asiatica TaxID=60517 RepID=A0A0R3WGJ3_TAEAS|nr:unnamed protein product [Taenia asiatica]